MEVSLSPLNFDAKNLDFDLKLNFENIVSFFLKLKFWIKMRFITLKQGRPPQESERGPYAVVDERCEDTTLKSV